MVLRAGSRVMLGSIEVAIEPDLPRSSKAPSKDTSYR